MHPGATSIIWSYVHTHDTISNITRFDCRAYEYEGSGYGHAQPHAVTQAGDNHFEYDLDGNMTLRVEVSGTAVITYWQAFNVENRLAVVTNTVTGEVTRFVYDGDGNRVLREDAGGVTGYFNAMEVHITGTQRVTKTYYFAGGRRIGMRAGVTVTYLHGDHLGSASLSTDASGGLVSEMRYMPYGVTRSGDIPTTQRFTDQRWESGLGLYDYGARYYSPALARFISADTIVPQPGNPQDFNRYAYVRNNPSRYIDPSGYDPLDQQWRNEFEKFHGRSPEAHDVIIRLFSLAYPEEWNWTAFYDENGNYLAGSLEKVLNESRPEDRIWENLPTALENLANWYQDEEELLFTRDIGTLFGGLKNRLEEPNAWEAVSYENNPARIWVYLGSEGLHPGMIGSDRDANVHHWAWALVMGAEYGPGGSTINTGREIIQAWQHRGDWNWRGTWSDVWIGNVGASLGCSFRILGIRRIREAWYMHMMEWAY